MQCDLNHTIGEQEHYVKLIVLLFFVDFFNIHPLIYKKNDNMY